VELSETGEVSFQNKNSEKLVHMVGSILRKIYLNLNSDFLLSYVSICYLQFVFSLFTPCTIKLLKLSINYYLRLFLLYQLN